MVLDIYFGTKATNGNNSLDNCRYIVDVLSKYGNVLTKHLLLDADKFKIFESEYERLNPGDNAFLRDRKWLNQSKCLVAEVSNPSTGLGWELREIESQKKPILAMYSKGNNISRLITYNDYELLDVNEYMDGDINNINNIVNNFFKKHKFKEV